MIFTRVLAIIALFSTVQPAAANSEITLFSGRGNAEAYIAVDDEMTIYLWDGKPVAYLDNDNSNGFNIYGFNGKHLGWFQNGVIWDGSGNASCAVKEAIQMAQIEPIKSIKEIKPIRAIKEIVPIRPILTNLFSNTPCQLLLGSGGN